MNLSQVAYQAGNHPGIDSLKRLEFFYPHGRSSSPSQVKPENATVVTFFETLVRLAQLPKTGESTLQKEKREFRHREKLDKSHAAQAQYGKY